MKTLALSVLLSLGLVTAMSGQTPTMQKKNLSTKGAMSKSLSSHKDVDLMYEQTMLDGKGMTCQTFETAYSDYDLEVADDFVIPEGGPRSILSVQPIINGSMAGDITMRVYDDAHGAPGNLVFSEVFASTDYPELTPTSCPLLHPGTYWVSLQVDQDFMHDGQVFWQTTTDSDAGPNPFALRNPGNGHDTGCTDWTIHTLCDFEEARGLAMYINISVVIPTVGQWGLIILGLLMMILGVVTIKKKSTNFGSV